MESTDVSKSIDNIRFINAGSIGKPKDGDPRTCLAVLEITKEATHTNFIRDRYDVEKVAKAIVLSGLPTHFAEKLRKRT